LKLDGTGGVAVRADLLTAYSYYGDPTSLKHFKLVRPIVQSLTEPALQAGVSVDYQLVNVDTYSMPTSAVVDLSEWDVAKWDQGTWAAAASIYRPWSSVVGLGFSGALRLEMTNSTATSFVAYEFVYETGGVV